MLNDLIKIQEYAKKEEYNTEKISLLILAYFNWNLSLEGNGWFDNIESKKREKIAKNFKLLKKILETK